MSHRNIPVILGITAGVSLAAFGLVSMVPGIASVFNTIAATEIGNFALRGVATLAGGYLGGLGCVIAAEKCTQGQGLASVPFLIAGAGVGVVGGGFGGYSIADHLIGSSLTSEEPAAEVSYADPKDYAPKHNFVMV